MKDLSLLCPDRRIPDLSYLSYPLVTVNTMEPHDLERLRRSIAMGPPFGQVTALTREDALDIIEHLQDVEARLRTLHDGLRKLVEEGGAA